MADDEEEWRFSVDEVGPDDPDAGDGPGRDEGDGRSVTVVGEDDDGPTVGFATDASDDTGEAGGTDDEGNVAGTLVPETPVEPGTPALENVAFATAGAVLTALVFAGVLGQLDAVSAAAITGVVAGGAGLLYVLFRRF